MFLKTSLETNGLNPNYLHLRQKTTLSRFHCFRRLKPVYTQRLPSPDSSLFLVHRRSWSLTQSRQQKKVAASSSFLITRIVLVLFPQPPVYANPLPLSCLHGVDSTTLSFFFVHRRWHKQSLLPWGQLCAVTVAFIDLSPSSVPRIQWWLRSVGRSVAIKTCSFWSSSSRKQNPTSKKFQKKGLANFSLLKEIFSGTITTGHHGIGSQTAANMPRAAPPDSVNLEAEGEGTGNSHEVQKNHNPNRNAEASSGCSKKKIKTVMELVVELLTKSVSL